MELFEANDEYILQRGDHSLWCSRIDGSLTAKRGEDLCNAWNPICLGRVYGVIGKVKVHPDLEPRLLLIRSQEELGSLPDCGPVFRITRVVLLPLSKESTKTLEIDMCEKHHFGIKKSSDVTRIPTDAQSKSLQKTWNQFRNAAESVKPKKMIPAFKMPAGFGELVTPLTQDQKDSKEKERFERKISEEILKMFQDGTFYYCPHGDVTNTTQRQRESNDARDVTSAPLWTHAHDAFFWNKYMLSDLIESENPLADPWIVPVIQGYIQIERCRLTFEDQYSNHQDVNHMNSESPAYQAIHYTLCLVSRRSRYRVGTRYKRRGVDEDGHCANFVETEQILEFSQHVVSFVQTRGSVPLYWSQTGIKYKPAPRIQQDEASNHEAFSKHMQRQLDAYQQVALVSLLDLGGKEKVMADAFLKHTVLFDSPDVTYVAFDFHEYCRGMKFENVAVLTEMIIEEIKNMRYCWADDNGLICTQKGVFRVNCLDCLDRTNVVQSAIARLVLEIQSRKLGLLPPDEELPLSSRLVYQQMWANNGDAVSRQYAGTAALKGDFTRTGERRLTGMMKDGVNSANRYYINKVKDAYKQTALDLLQGNAITEDLAALRVVSKQGAEEGETETSLVEKEQDLKVLIDECRKMLITEPEDCLGSWGLIDCDPVTGDPTQHDMDIILLVSQRAYYVARYDDEADQVTSYQKIFLEDLERFEIGPAPATFKSRHLCVRIYYTRHEESGYFHTFRTTGTRLFNNIVIHINNDEEARESLRAIYEAFAAARQMMSHPLPVAETRLEKKRSKPHVDIVDIASQAQEKADVLPKRSALVTVSSQPNIAALQTQQPRPESPLATEHSDGRDEKKERKVEEGTREITGNSRESPENHRQASSFLRATKSSFTKHFMKFKPSVRVPGQRQSSGFLPAVIYNRDQEQTEQTEQEQGNVAESARILKGDKILEKTTNDDALLINFGPEPTPTPETNINQSDVSSSLLIDFGPTESTNTSNLHQLQENSKSERKHNDLLVDLGLPGEENSNSDILQHDDNGSFKKAVKTQMSLDPSRLRPKSVRPKPKHSDVHLAHAGAIAIYAKQLRFNPYPKLCIGTIRKLLQDSVLNDIHAKSPTQPNIDIAIDAASAIDEWVNVEVFDDSSSKMAAKTGSSYLTTPRSIRPSVSESALDERRIQMEALLVSSRDLEREAAANTNADPALTFLSSRMRLGALPASTYETAHERKKAVLDLAASNKLLSQKLFKKCNSKVILL